MRVLIVEDDPIIIEGLKIALSQEGYEVEHAETVKAALGKMEKFGSDPYYDICLLDVMLPDGDGYQICKAIRARSQVPILFLTACDDEVHTVLALEQGADDYIAKPFRIRELIARMKAILRRTGCGAAAAGMYGIQTESGNANGNATGVSGDSGWQGKQTEGGVRGNGARSESLGVSGNAPRTESGDMGGSKTMVGENEVDIMSGKVFRHGDEVFLSAVEYRLLLTFLRSRGRLLTRQQILNDMWDQAGDFVNDNTLTVYVKRLRKKLEEDGAKPLIETVRGIGYRML